MGTWVLPRVQRRADAVVAGETVHLDHGHRARVRAAVRLCDELTLFVLDDVPTPYILGSHEPVELT